MYQGSPHQIYIAIRRHLMSVVCINILTLFTSPKPLWVFYQIWYEASLTMFG